MAPALECPSSSEHPVLCKFVIISFGYNNPINLRIQTHTFSRRRYVIFCTHLFFYCFLCYMLHRRFMHNSSNSLFSRNNLTTTQLFVLSQESWRQHTNCSFTVRIPISIRTLPEQFASCSRVHRYIENNNLQKYLRYETISNFIRVWRLLIIC